MPRRAKHVKMKAGSGARKLWILYSFNREFCFKEEIEKGIFAPGHLCGCSDCAPDFQLPLPGFADEAAFKQDHAKGD